MRRNRMNVALAAAGALALAAAGCELRPQPSARARQGAAQQQPQAAKDGADAPQDALARGNPRLAAAIRGVLGSCEIDKDSGLIRRCREEPVRSELQQTELDVGADQTLLTYCRAYDDRWNKPLRALATRRLNLVGTPRQVRQVSHSTYQCLLGALQQELRVVDLSALAHVAAYVGTALGTEQELLDLVGKLVNKSPQVVVHSALWPNGRLRVLPRLQQVLSSGEPADQQLKAAVLRGFGRLEPETGPERQAVCPLLLPLLEHQDTATASAAAYRVSRSCFAAERDRLLAVAARLVRARRFDQTYVAALGGWGLPPDRAWSAAQSRRAVGLLTRVLQDAAIPALVRGTALRGIFNLDPARGKQLARRHARPGTPGPIREPAQQILGQPAQG